MRFNIHPAIPYAFGTILLVFGIVRAKYLGAPREGREPAEGSDAPPETSAVRGPAERRHVRWGIIDILMGLGLIIWTFVETHRR